jgi:hypothetical protein
VLIQNVDTFHSNPNITRCSRNQKMAIHLIRNGAANVKLLYELNSKLLVGIKRDQRLKRENLYIYISKKKKKIIGMGRYNIYIVAHFFFSHSSKKFYYFVKKKKIYYYLFIFHLLKKKKKKKKKKFFFFFIYYIDHIVDSIKNSIEDAVCTVNIFVSYEKGE